MSRRGDSEWGGNSEWGGDRELPPVNWEYTHAMHAGGRFGMNKLKKTRAFFSSADINLGVWDQTKIYLQI